jgi:hypothetical protein
VRKRGSILLLAILAAAVLWSRAALSASAQWPGFQIIMWQTKTPLQYRALRHLGVTAARVQADRSGETATSAEQKVLPITEAGLRPYVENIATDFYSAYHRWRPDRPVNAAYLEVQQAIAADPADQAAFIRQPSLSDKAALGKIEKRLTDIVRIYEPYNPLFFDLGDETGIADLSAAWDFDFSPASLAGMRRWLQEQYGALDALNREWETEFASWEDVTPPTTTEAMMRTDGNYAAWSDFKAWMDVSFSDAIAAGTQAVHAGSPSALAAIEGGQMPGWGGYDYTRLSAAVDVMEPSGAGEGLELAQSFNPGLIPLMTVNWARPGALHRSWHEFLRGVRGMVVWDPDDHFVHLDGSIGPDGRAATLFIDGMKSGAVSLILASQPVRDPVAIVYSPESYRLQWLIDHRAMGASWTRLGSADENADNAVRAARRRAISLLDQLGIKPNFVSDAQIARGRLEQANNKIVILPQTLALSAEAADAIRAFVKAGGILVAEGEAGTFDGHGRRLSQSQLPTLLNGINPRAFALHGDDKAALEQLRQALKAVGISPKVTVAKTTPEGPASVEHYVYRNGELTVLALLANPFSNEAQSGSKTSLSLRQRSYIYDVGAKQLLGHAKEISVSVDSVRPIVLALSTEPLAMETCRSLLHWPTCPSAAGNALP